MHDFEYSIDALNAKNAFLKTDAIIYVEGDDDVLFWHEIFSKIPGFNFSIEPRGGSNELDKYIMLINSGELNAIAARDSDYLKYTNKLIKSSRVVYTLGYSIENTLYTASAILLLTKSWCKTPDLPEKICDEWIDNFSSSFFTLLAQDIANAKTSAGLNVLYDNCGKFMKGKSSSAPCSATINEKINEIDKQISTESIQDYKNKIDRSAEQICLTIRGHFLSSAVARFISEQAKYLGKKISLSGDGLYTSAMMYFSGNFREKHPHYRYYIDAATAAANDFKN